MRSISYGNGNSLPRGSLLLQADVLVLKYRMPMSELRPDIAHTLVSDELILDGNPRQNLATFCTTYLDAEVHHLMDASIDKNMIDYPCMPLITSLNR